MLIRSATPADAATIAAIYDHHARTGSASFDNEGPDSAAWEAKVADVLARGWPFLVAEDAGEVIGFAYATQFRDRPGYRFTCEDSIYLDPASTGKGIGSKLLEQVIAAARAFGFEQMIAVVGGGEPASVGLHRAFGFEERGRMRDVGTKFGRKFDTVYLQLKL